MTQFNAPSLETLKKLNQKALKKAYDFFHETFDLTSSRSPQIAAVISTYLDAVGDGWEPIETAPKDGTPIDLLCERSWNPPNLYQRLTDRVWCDVHNLWRTKGVLQYVEHDCDEKRENYLKPVGWTLSPPFPSPPQGDGT